MRSNAVNIKNSYPSQIAEGWSLSNVHEFDKKGMLYLGNGDVINIKPQSIILKTGQTVSFVEYDDGDYQTGGNTIKYHINEDGHLVDQVTQLIWEFTDTPAMFTDRSQAAAYCANKDQFDSYHWRLPTTKEVTYSQEKSGKIMSALIYDQDESQNLWYAQAANPEQRLMPVLCVSSKHILEQGNNLDEAAVNELTQDTDNQVVLDRATGLMWQDTGENQTLELPWESAIQYCEHSDHAGYSDWRLPNINELLLVLPNPTFANQTQLVFPPDTPLWQHNVDFRQAYWSSTTHSRNQNQAWAIESISFNSPYFLKEDALHVRCVRTAESARNMPYVFNAKGQHIETIDLNSGVTLVSFGYNQNHQLETITDQFGNQTQLIWDVDGKLDQIIGSDHQVTDIYVDQHNNLKTVTYEDSTYFSFDYDGTLLTAKTDPNQHTFHHYFDEEGRVDYTTDPEGGLWDFYNLRESLKNTYGYTTAEGNSYQVVRKELDDNEIENSVTLENGAFIKTRYASDFMSSSIEYCGVTTTYENQEDPKTRIAIPGITTTILPSGLTRTVTQTKEYGNNGADTMAYTHTRTEGANTFTTEVDSRTGITQITTPENRTTQIVKDPVTQLLERVQPSGLHATEYEYDDRGRIALITTGDRTTTYYYDDAISQGNVTTITTPDNQTMTYGYDALGRIESVQYQDGYQTQSYYDDNGNVDTIVVPFDSGLEQDYEHGFEINGVNRVKAINRPLSSATVYHYDKDRRLTGITLPSGDDIVHHYAMGKLDYTDTPEGRIDYDYLCGDQLQSIHEGDEWLTYDYDGTLLTDISYQGLLNETLNYQYNHLFQVSHFTYAGQTEHFNYDGDGLLTQSGVFDIDRHPQHGLPESISDTHITHSLTYNDYGEGKTRAISVGSNSVYQYELFYDEAGTINGKTETLPNGDIVNWIYTYDDRKRLDTVTKNGVLVESYSYDANGNRINGTSIERGIENQNASYNTGDQLQTLGDITYTYDENGRLKTKTTSGQVTTYEYSSLGRLLKVTTPTNTIEYKHNALGNRVAKILNGEVVEKYLWKDKTTLLATYDKDDNLKQRFEYSLGHSPVAFEENGNRYYVLTNQIGSPRFITNESGSIVKQIDYDSFGNVVLDSNPAIEIPFGFAGGLKDEHTGLIRFGYRDYDPEAGRWTARDPIGFAGGDTNLYGYVASSPVQFIDLMGLAKCLFTLETGILTCRPEDSSNSGVSISVASGNNGNGKTCRNNPDCTSIKGHGPIPTGCWKWTDGWTGKKNGRVLEPCDGTDTNKVEDRTLIRSHSCKYPFGPGKGPTYCSEGCVTGTEDDIKELNKLLDAEPGSTLIVRPDTPRKEPLR